MLVGSTAGLRAQIPVPVVERAHPFVNYTELGGLFGRVAYPTFAGSTTEQVENKVSLTIQTFNGAKVSPRLAVGGIVGIDWYANALLLPVGAGLRYDLTRATLSNVNLYVAADVGYGLTWLNKASTDNSLTNGGLMLNPGLGLRFGKPGKGAFLLSLSYKRQVVDANKPLSWNDIRRDEHRVYNRLAVRLGLSF
jgi:hypothetical protein